ncbi:conserved hypothetical protein [Frankia canadensis]|uniref:Uncharacterized protein n=1 Tax=Frankia canadensis TaxID=1836972 RepID=A0A2I2KKK5_9ACTN|nr:hypothetical protein [Frankia canadensis]SNQ46200.1 conserved hypothetical protein [Frankia canadensis]SOU53490.1 conserved hypothetical protein [Frankia canadensis]
MPSPPHGRARPARSPSCLTALLGGCGSSPAEPEQLGPAKPYGLYTHCGISEAHYQDRYYELVPPLHDGNLNPPDGWGNPYQNGILTPVSRTEVVFTDDAGHRVTFTLRPGATTWKRICE